MAGKRLSAALEEYIKIQQAKTGGNGHRGDITARCDNNVLRMFMRMTGDRMLTSLTPQHIEAWFYGPGGIMDDHKVLSQRAGKAALLPAVSASTHNQYRSRLKMFFTWCIQRGYMKSDVMVHVQPMKVQKRTRIRPGAMTLLELLDAADNPRDRAYIALAMNTGLRQADARQIRVGDVDLEDGWLSTEIRKTRGADEKPITLELHRELTTWLTIYANDIGRPLRDDDYLFPRRTGGLVSHYVYDEWGNPKAVRHPLHWVTDKYVRETHLIVQKALKSIGIPTYREGTHTIRRSVARLYFDSVAAEKGDSAALRETAAFLNHSSTSTTEIYLGITIEKERRDKRLRGKGFLTEIAKGERTESTAGDIIELRPIVGGE